MSSAKSRKFESSNMTAKETLPDLPFDLLKQITSLLPLKHNIIASSVCKTLHEACVSVRVPDNSPWLIYFKPNGSCELYNPSIEKTYNLEFPELSGFRICYSKDGWLLLYNPESYQLLFLNPFTRDRIPVPPHWMAYDDIIAFSCSPTSSDCLLFTVTSGTSHIVVTVKTCRPNDKEWNTFTIKTTKNYYTWIKQIVFSNGVFYCLANTDLLLIFDPSSSSCNVSPWSSLICGDCNRCFMTEHEGEIFLIYMYNHMNTTVYKLNRATLEWIEREKLGGLTIYASPLSSITKAEQEKRNCLCISVYRGFKKTCIFYKVGEETLFWFKFKKQDLYGNIWIMPPLNILELSFV